MAVVDVNIVANPVPLTGLPPTDQSLHNMGVNSFTRGSVSYRAISTVTIGATDNNTSIYRVFQNVPGRLVPLNIQIGNTAMAGTTSMSLGIYLSTSTGTGGVAKAANALANAFSVAAAHASLSELTALDGMTAVLPATIGPTLGCIAVLAGDTLATAPGLGYDIALTMNTTGGVGGTITVCMEYYLPNI